MQADYLEALAFHEPNKGPGWPDRWGGESSRGRDPSPEQILERCAEIRQTWTRRERFLRGCGRHGQRTEAKAERWMPPVFSDLIMEAAEGE